MTIPGAIVTSIPATAVSGEQPESPADGIAVLTSGMAARDENAFRQFHAEYYDRLLRYLLVVGRGDEQAAHDALQETFVRVARHARRFDDAAVFWSWLTVLARSAATDVNRKSNRYWRLITSYAAAWIGGGASSIEPEPAEDRLVTLVTRGVARLDELDRNLVEGKYLAGASVRQLAARYSLTEKAVESRLRRARLQLRRQLLVALKENDES